MTGFQNYRYTVIVYFLLLLLCNLSLQAQPEEKNLNPKISAGIGFQSPPLIGKKADVKAGMSSNVFITIPLTCTRKINLVYKFIYWEGNSALTDEKFNGWGTSISFMYAIINNPRFKLKSYFGPYSVNSLIPISFSAFNLRIQLEYYPHNNFNFGIDINQLLN